ncbi:hypothetical protein TWF696_005227 [Orbilia brochopaga]|uniref:CUE domain-containing protein n=1 Tax=Orbilia brochopaga TaxID=3140254 RepID=A0AAV9V116_9PEZI
MSLDADDLAGSSPSPSSSPSLSQLIFCALVVLLVYRYVISSPQPQDAGASSHTRPTRTTNRAVPADAIEALRAMFPQVSAAAISWDLERNGGNLEATTEKILTEGSLPEPPASFARAPRREAISPASTSTQPRSGGVARATVTSTASSSTPKLSGHSDLISRYNLQSRLETAQPGKLRPAEQGSSINKNDKSSLILRGQERRDAMIIEARKKMETMLSKR